MMPRDLYKEYLPVIQRIFQENGYSQPFAPGTLMRAKQAAQARQDAIKKAQQDAEAQAKAAQKLMEQAALEAARAKAKQAKSAGDSLDTDIKNKEFRLKNAGVDPNNDPRNWLEKALNLPKKQNWFLDTLDVLNRPLHGVMNTINEAVKQGKENAKNHKNPHDVPSQSLSKIASDFAKGVSGHADTSGSDVLNTMGIKNKYAKGIGGFAADVALDPLNVVPVGALAKPIELAVKGARKIPIVDKSASVTSDAVRSLFSPNYGKDVTLNGMKDSDLLNLERDYINKGRYYKDKSYTDILKAIKNTDGGLGAGTDIGKAMEKSLIPDAPVVSAPNVLNTKSLVQKALDNLPNVKTYYNPKADLVKKIGVKSSAEAITDPAHAKQVDDLVKEIENTKNMYKDAMDSHVQEGITPHLQKETEWHTLNDIENEYQKVRDQIGKIDIPAENRSDWADQVPRAFKSGKNTKRNTDLYAAADQMGFDNVDDFVKYLQDIDYAHKAVKGGKTRFMNLGQKEVPTKPFKLPKHLQGAKPRYGYQHNVFNLNFKNDIEKAIYTVTNKGKSLKHDAYLDEIKKQTGLSDEEITKLGQQIRDHIKGQAKNGADDVIDVPSIAKLTKSSPKTLNDIEEELRQDFHLTEDAKAMRSTIKAMQEGLDDLNSKAFGKVAADIAVHGSVPEGIAASLLAKQPVEKIAKKLSKNPSINRAAKLLIKSNDALRKLAADHGISISNIQGYMAHVLTDEAKEAMDKIGGGKGLKKVGGDYRVLNRTIHDTVENINKYMSKKYGIPNFDFFNPNAFFATTIGQQRMINFIMAEGLKKEVLSNSKFAMKYEKGMHIPKGATVIDLGSYSFAKDGINKASDMTGKYVVTEGAKTVLDNFNEALSDHGIRKLLSGYDKIQGQWKKLALFSVGFHVRNLLGNMFNMYVRGMKPSEIVGYNTVAGHVLAKAKKGLLKSPGSLTDKEKQAVKLYDEFKRQGLKEMSAYDIEFALKNQKTLTQNLKRDTSGRVKKLATDLNPVNSFKSSRRVGEMADEANRFAMYLWARRAKKMSPEKAAGTVRETLFDYSNITPAEKAIFKRLFPFWTWMRNNIQFQVTQLVKNPAAYGHLGLAINDSYQATGTDKSLVPDWMKESLGMPVSGKKNGDASLFMPNLPAADLSKIGITATPKALIDSLTPLAKVPIELYANKSLLTGAPIQKFPGETKDVLGQKVDSRLAYAINQLGAVRNLSGNVSNLKQGNVNPLGSLLKPFDKSKEEKNQKYARIRDLDAMEDKFEQDSGSKLPTVKQYEDAGIYRDKQLSGMTKYLKKQGYSSDQQAILMNLYKKVINNGSDYADKVRQALEQQGLPSDVIDKITADYLVY